MSKYIKKNCAQSLIAEICSLQQAIDSEIVELHEERYLSIAWCMELSDVIYCKARMLSTKHLSRSQLEHLWPWYILFWSAPPTTIKLAWRYAITGCIRSKAHHIALDHRCPLSFKESGPKKSLEGLSE